MRKLLIGVGSVLVLLAARPAAAEFISFGWAGSDGYGVSFSVGDPYYSPDPYYTGPYYPDPYAGAAPVYIPVPIVVYPPPPPVVVYSPPVIYRSVIVHRPIVEKRVIVRRVVRDPVVVKRHVVVKEREVVHRRQHDRPSGHGGGFPPGLQRIEHRR